MSSIKVVLRAKKNKDNTYPLAIRITRNRKSSFIHLGYNLFKKDWNVKHSVVQASHPNSKRLNNYIAKKVSEVNASSLELDTDKSEVSAHAVKQKVRPKGGATFSSQAQLYLDTLKAAGNYNVYTADKPRVKHFKEFLKESDIALTDITVSVLQEYQVYLKTKPVSKFRATKNESELKRPRRQLKVEDTKPVKFINQRTLMNHLVVIRSIFSQAIGMGAIDKKYYPFGKDGISIIMPPSKKLGLSPEEVSRIEELELFDARHDHARNIWLFAYYFAGMRISDVFRLKWSDINDGRLYYTMGKNQKEDSLKIPVKAQKILDKYQPFKRSKHDFVFPDLKDFPYIHDEFLVERKIAFATSRYDKFLRLHVATAADIDKPLTMHIARHTFGNVSGPKIAPQVLQKLYRHSHIETTIGYQYNFIHEDVDKALDAVVGK